jgi:hypothetical protein
MQNSYVFFTFINELDSSTLTQAVYTTTACLFTIEASNNVKWCHTTLVHPGRVVGAAIARGITAYPINSWLVKNKLKHGCMTLPDKSATMSMHQDNPAEHHHQHAKADSMHGHEHSQHSMTTLPVQKAILIMLVAFAGLLLSAWLTSVFLAPISFR